MAREQLADQHAQPSPILLILDDYHVINEPTIHSSLTSWLEHLPLHVHLLLASRADPDLPIAQWSRLSAGLSDDLGTGATATAPHCCQTEP